MTHMFRLVEADQAMEPTKNWYLNHRNKLVLPIYIMQWF